MHQSAPARSRSAETRAAQANVEGALALIDERHFDEYWVGALAHLAKGRVLRHARRSREAETELARAVVLGRRGVGVIELTYALVMLADLRRELGERRSARELVIEARALLNEAPDPGSVVPRLLERAERSLRLVSQLHGMSLVPSGQLTAREQTVLRLLPSGLSTLEIGDQLGVSRNTSRPTQRACIESSVREAGAKQ